MLDAGEQRIAARLKTLPDGRWSHRAFTEAGAAGRPQRLRLPGQRDQARRAADRRQHGNRPQAGSINVTYAAFAGAVQASIVSQLASDLSGVYGGAYRRIEVRPEPGLLSCADHPAAVSPSGAFTTEMLLNATAIAVGKMVACSSDPAVAARGWGRTCRISTARSEAAWIRAGSCSSSPTPTG